MSQFMNVSRIVFTSINSLSLIYIKSDILTILNFECLDSTQMSFYTGLTGEFKIVHYFYLMRKWLKHHFKTFKNSFCKNRVNGILNHKVFKNDFQVKKLWRRKNWRWDFLYALVSGQCHFIFAKRFQDLTPSISLALKHISTFHHSISLTQKSSLKILSLWIEEWRKTMN